MPGKDAMDVLIEIKERWNQLPVVIFSMNPDEIYAVRMIKNGASAYINKETKPKQIIEILRSVLQGHKYYSQLHSDLLAEIVTDPGKSKLLPHQNLTDREFQVFSMLTSGMSKSEIADKLAISKNTLGNHRNNIMKKMNITTNAELVRYAIQNGIIQ